MLKIVSVPNPVLSSSAKPVLKIDEKIKNLISEMKKTLLAQKDPIGVGLAANQVGKNLSIFIIKPSEKAKIKVFINPKILKLVNPLTRKSNNKKKHPVKLEGCLSIPHVWGSVKRAKKVFLEYQDLTTESVKRRWFQGFEAVIIQHEIDHLNGIVFTQRTIEQKGKLYKEIDDKLTAIKI